MFKKIIGYATTCIMFGAICFGAGVAITRGQYAEHESNQSRFIAELTSENAGLANSLARAENENRKLKSIIADATSKIREIIDGLIASAVNAGEIEAGIIRGLGLVGEIIDGINQLVQVYRGDARPYRETLKIIQNSADSAANPSWYGWDDNNMEGN